MDVAFGPGGFPGFTTRELMLFIMDGRDANGEMRIEIERRNRVAAGDFEAMTHGERLRYSRNGGYPNGKAKQQ